MKGEQGIRAFLKITAIKYIWALNESCSADILSAVVIPLPSFLFTLLICFDTGAKNAWRSAGGAKHGDSSARLVKDGPRISGSVTRGSPPTLTTLLRQGHLRPGICCAAAAPALPPFSPGCVVLTEVKATLFLFCIRRAAKPARPAADLRGEAVSRH